MQNTQNVWTYSQDLGSLRSDIVGYGVEATDGHIGKIDEASTETDRAHVVVDTGFWIFGKKRLIPAGVIRQIDDTERKVWVSMSKEQIKNAPDWDADWYGDTASRSQYSEYYGPYGW